MERSEILAAMGELKLYGMKATFDEIIAAAVKRQHEPQHIVGDMLTAEIIEKQARSTSTRSPSPRALAKNIDDFIFDDASINEILMCDLAGSEFLAISATSC